MEFQRLKNLTGRIVLTSGFVLGVVLIFAVRPNTEDKKDRTTVELWRVVGSEDVEPAVPEWFNESQDEIYVKPVGLPFLEIEQKFLTAAVGNIPPDLFEYFGSVAQWSTRGALMPLDEYMERDNFDRSKIFAASWEEMMWDGRTYAIPTGTANEAFYWNKDHFRAAGLDPDRPPKTWKELEEYALKLTTYNEDGSIDQAGYIPGYWSPFPGSLFLDWPVQKGAKFMEDDGRTVNLTAPANVEALAWEGQLFQELGGDKLIEKRASFGYGSQQGFASGQLSMILQKSSFVQELQKFAPDLDYGVAPLPVPEDGEQAVIAGSVWIGIPAGAEHPEEAWEFIKYYVQTDTQIRSAQFAADNDLATFFPANIEAANSPVQQSQPHNDVFVESMNFAHPSTVIPLAHTQFWRSYQTAWDKVMRGSATAEEALQMAQEEVQNALDEQIAYNEFYSKYLEEKEESGEAVAGGEK